MVWPGPNLSQAKETEREWEGNEKTSCEGISRRAHNCAHAENTEVVLAVMLLMLNRARAQTRCSPSGLRLWKHIPSSLPSTAVSTRDDSVQNTTIKVLKWKNHFVVKTKVKKHNECAFKTSQQTQKNAFYCQGWKDFCFFSYTSKQVAGLLQGACSQVSSLSGFFYFGAICDTNCLV